MAVAAMCCYALIVLKIINCFGKHLRDILHAAGFWQSPCIFSLLEIDLCAAYSNRMSVIKLFFGIHTIPIGK